VSAASAVHPRSGVCLRARRSEIVLAAVLVPLADGLGRVDARFDSEEAARREVAQTVVPLIHLFTN
jgi:hypothetical protein